MKGKNKMKKIILILLIFVSSVLSGCARYYLISKHDLEWTKRAYFGLGYVVAISGDKEKSIDQEYNEMEGLIKWKV